MQQDLESLGTKIDTRIEELKKPSCKLLSLDNLQEFASGSFSKVYKCIIKETGEVAAVKIFMGQYTEKFFFEAASLSLLRHYNIVKYLGIVHFKTPECPISIYGIVEELMNENLDTWILRNHENDSNYFDYCFYFTKQIVEGLAYLHANNIAHRDLKPSNILVSNWVVKIADISEGYIFGSMEDSMSVHGSLKYLAPEELLKRKGIDKREIVTMRSDIWKFGLILLQLWSRRMALKDWTEKKLEDYGLLKRFPKDLIPVATWQPTGINILIRACLELKGRPIASTIIDALKDLGKVTPQSLYNYEEEEQDHTYFSQRQPCRYGKDCYRKNPAHKEQFSHPGD